MTTDMERLRASVIPILAAAHHAYCHDTGCFDGDDISQPEIEVAAMLVVADEVATALRDADQDGVYIAEAIAAAEALVAQLRGGAG